MSKREFSFVNVRSSRVAKKTVSYCNTSDSELKFDEDGYKRSKTKSFKKKANAANSDSDEFELGPRQIPVTAMSSSWTPRQIPCFRRLSRTMRR